MHEPTSTETPSDAQSVQRRSSPSDAGASDPKVLQVLTAEHFDLLSARGLAYNEAFTRAGIFLTFLSMSFVALALLAQAMSFTRDFLVVVAVVLAFSFLIGLATYARIIDIVADDLRAMHGMNRIRHGYVRQAPEAGQYFTNGTHDDIASVMANYGTKASSRTIRGVVYGLSTSLGLVGMIVALVGGGLASVITLAAGDGGWPVLAVGGAATLIILSGLARWGAAEMTADQESLPVRFPAPPGGSAASDS